MSDDCQFLLGDCLDRMAEVADGSVDLIACDPPYGVTQCRWDTVIPFEPMWAHFKRVLKPQGAVVLTASQPFTSMLVMSNPKWFRFDVIWNKGKPTGHLNANRRPMCCHESILMFASTGRFTYNPQKTSGEPARSGKSPNTTDVYNAYNSIKYINPTGFRFPISIISVSRLKPTDKHERIGHTVQKPVALLEYLIRTYSNEGETVLDCCMGSGTTGVACLNTGRRFIGIEKDERYFRIAKSRLASVQRPLIAV